MLFRSRVSPWSIVALALSAVFALMLLHPFSLQHASAKGKEKVDVCHYSDDEDTYHLINVAVPAVPAHVGHGDPDPGDLGGACEVGVGECAAEGTVVCAEDGQGCDAVPGEPSDEVCDGLDNDCDGAVDELDGECSVGVGACEATGGLVCNDEGEVECTAVPGPSSPELCDGLDNDCDGQVDEDFGLGGACVVGIGACENVGVLVCGPDGAVCDAVPGDPSAEVCDDGIDNDCDGLVDDADLADCP